jgi:hypothetical protein
MPSGAEARARIEARHPLQLLEQLFLGSVSGLGASMLSTA